MDEVAARCPWCSSILPDPSVGACPTCGATLVAAPTDAQIPGVTTVSPEVVVRSRPVRRSRLLAWISGEVADDVGTPRSPEGALAPPPDAVRLEILRLEREAAVARGDLPPASSTAADEDARASDVPASDAPASDLPASDAPAGDPARSDPA